MLLLLLKVNKQSKYDFHHCSMKNPKDREGWIRRRQKKTVKINDRNHQYQLIQSCTHTHTTVSSDEGETVSSVLNKTKT